MTPLEFKFLYEDETINDRTIVEFLSEGTMTEVGFYSQLFSKGSPLKPHNTLTFKEAKKTGNDKGVSDPITLVNLAKREIDNNHDFDKNKDKIIITFDLDRVEDDNRLNELKSLKEPYIIYCFTNPKFEMYMLLTLLDDLSDLEREYYEKGFPNNILERNFSNIAHHNSKTKGAGIFVAKNVQHALAISKYDSNRLSLNNSFFTNVNLLINAIIDGSIVDW